MNGERLNDALTGVDEKYAEESRPTGSAKRKLIWIPAAAACLALLIGAILVLKAVSGRKPEGSANAVPTEYAEPTAAPTEHTSPQVYAAAIYPETPLFTGKAEKYMGFVNSLGEKGVFGAGAGLGSFYNGIAAELLFSENENMACSPFSIYLALAMLAETSEGETRDQMLRALNADSIEDLREQYAKLYEANYRSSGDKALTEPAASVWLESKIGCRPETAEQLAETYRASVFGGSMGDPEYDALIRAWLEERTHGLLSDMTEDAALTTPGTVMKLISTLSFKAGWRDAFYDAHFEEVFHAASGDKTVSFLKGMADRFIETDGYTLVGKALADGSMMWFALSAEGTELSSLRSEAGPLVYLLNGEQEGYDDSNIEGFFEVPEFDVASEQSLESALKSLGVTDCFDPERADFSPISDIRPLYVSSAAHGVRVICDKDGITAEAFSQFDVTNGPRERRSITLDRPFMFILMSADNTPLFVGTVCEP